ncbi:uncharacterized protein KQ657_002650 [Scheffersomyces spartinae]|uniref:Lethal giant larvae (Lgl)-like C-terminal domain-containing protein n=1 Tax=Scheffersomyces spartinae TaxID=45513 RepID=A0A9P8AGP9_9ASCO|nr:uncharacterized protein KQ657_002650 [Scheffersomyces spartinae]KAG7191861.1 hypothetical protein KQ657_002650 [Scheffersomyces spartinae]
MFSKLKLKKAPISLTSVSNKLKTSTINDLSPTNLKSKDLDIYAAYQLGLPNNSIIASAFDPVQSLLAVSTKSCEVRVFGSKYVEVVFLFNLKNPITFLRFVKGVYLVAACSLGSIQIISLHSKDVIGAYNAPSMILSIETDPSVDWLIIGLGNGSVLFYDIDRLTLTPYRMENLQKQILPKEKLLPVLGIEWNPRDLGTVLLTYSHCAIIYSLATASIKQFFVYRLDKSARAFEYSKHFANNGKKKLFGSGKDIISEITEAHWHPNSLHVVTVHADNTLAFWDANDSTLIEARIGSETGVNKPGSPIPLPDLQTFRPTQTVRWICGEDAEYTQLVVANSNPSNLLSLTIMDFGYTLKYSLTSHDKQRAFYATPTNGQRQISFKFNNTSKPDVEPEFIKSITPINSPFMPYYGGNQNPIYMMLISNYGSIYFVTSPFTQMGIPDLDSLILPETLTSLHPPTTYMKVETVSRVYWFGILSSRTGAAAKFGTLLKGGMAASSAISPRSVNYDDSVRQILVSGHKGGYVRLCDVSRNENTDSESIVQLNLALTLFNDGNPRAMDVTHVSTAFASREMLVGLANGEVVVCKFGKVNKLIPSKPSTDYTLAPVQHQNGNAKLISISDRILGSFASTYTFLPSFLLQIKGNYDPITCLKMNDIGFGAIAYKSGRLIVCDITRGPAIIYNLDDIKEKLVTVQGECFVTSVEFTIMEYGQDGYSLILLCVGTNGGGHFMTFKIIPRPNGGFLVDFAERTVNLNYKGIDSNGDGVDSSAVTHIIPIESKKGASAVATLDTFHQLGQGIPISGYLILGSNNDLRVLKPPKTKLAHKVIDEGIVGCGVVDIHGTGVCLVSILKAGFLKLSTIPSLGDLADIKLPKEISPRVAYGSHRSTHLSRTGEFYVSNGGNEVDIFSLYLKDLNKHYKGKRVTDQLFDPAIVIPARPAMNVLQWAKGLPAVSAKDLANLIAGPNRRPPKTEESRLAHNISPEANPNHPGYVAATGSTGGGLSADMKAGSGYEQSSQRSTNIGGGQGYNQYTNGIMRSFQDTWNTAEETLNDYANSMSTAMTDTYDSGKKSFYTGAVKSKLGI